MSSLCNQSTLVLTQERERRSPPFNHLRMHPFSEGVSALQIYCMKEGVKVGPGRTASYELCSAKPLVIITIILFSSGEREKRRPSSPSLRFFFFLQDVCIPDLIKLLDILGDNGVISDGCEGSSMCDAENRCTF